ncbi:MAG: MoaD/ThiS family protein [Chloroflexi bacterium]|nr:MoaD/ThiS family protein [Chloroflexota bacterium]
METCQVSIPTPLRKYTDGQRVVETQGSTLREMLDAMECAYPGFKFRVVNEQGQLREHIRLFINQRIAPDLDAAIQPNDAVRIILAISGGS